MNTSTASLPLSILLYSDNRSQVSPIYNALTQAGFEVHLAHGYEQLEQAWHADRHSIVLFEVSSASSIEPATAAALRIKRLDSGQFVGYLADANLLASGLTGDAIFARNASTLPRALRAAFEN